MADLTVIYARIVRKPGHGAMFDRSFSQDVREALDPNVTAEWYGRTWRLSRPVDMDGGFLAGKLGFVRGEGQVESEYDEATQDYIQLPSSPHAYFSHWVLDLQSQVIAFEADPPLIRQSSFIGGLDAILEENAEYPFDVVPLMQEEAFFAWLATVDKIFHFRAVLRPPNPRWDERLEQLEAAVSQTEAELYTMDVRTDPKKEKGLVVTGTIIEEAALHSEAGYGTISADGIKDGVRHNFNSKRKSRRRKIAEEVVANAVSMFDVIKGALRGSDSDGSVEASSNHAAPESAEGRG